MRVREVTLAIASVLIVTDALRQALWEEVGSDSGLLNGRMA